MSDTAKPLIYYKIQNRYQPDLFLASNGRWNKTGKIYDTLGKLRSKMTQTMKWRASEMADWRIVEYEVQVRAVRDVHEVMTGERLIELLAR